MLMDIGLQLWLTVKVFLVILVNVYVYNSSGQNKILFSNISEGVAQIKSKFHTHLVLIGGDFNLAPDLAGQISF